MKKKLTGFLGFGDKGELWVCDRCGKKTTGGCRASNKDGLFQSLLSGEFCFDCLKSVDKEATHLWTPLSCSSRHFENTFISEMNSQPPTRLDYCAKCYTYRAIEKLGNNFKGTYFPIGSGKATSEAPICTGDNNENPNLCKHDYVKVFNNEKNPTSSEVKDAKRLLKQIQGDVVGQIFGYDSIDMSRSTYGFSVYWCSKCGTSRTITKGQNLPFFGTDSDFPARYRS